MEEKIGIIFYSDRQVLVELFLGENEKTFFPKVIGVKPKNTASKALSTGDFNKIKAKVRERYRVKIDNPGPLLTSSNRIYLIIGEWEEELPDMTPTGNRLVWVNLNEVLDILSYREDAEAIKEFREKYYEITDKEKNTLGIATKEETEKYQLYHRPL